MDVVLSKIKWQYALVYSDDVLLFSRTLRKHIKHAGTFSQLLKSSGVVLNLHKSTAFTNRIYYIGHIIQSGQRDVANHTADNIQKLKTQTTVTELPIFVGLCDVFKIFVQNFAGTASPFSRRPRKPKAKDLGPLEENELQALDTLKEKLILPPLPPCRSRKGTTLYT